VALDSCMAIFKPPHQANNTPHNKANMKIFFWKFEFFRAHKAIKRKGNAIL
jgi:hypothetical protein